MEEADGNTFRFSLCLDDARALALTAEGVKSLLYPYTQITAVGLGTALLTARFTLHSMGNAPACEIALQSGDVPWSRTAARLISARSGERVEAERGRRAGWPRRSARVP